MTWAEKTRRGIEDWATKKPAPDKPSWGDRLATWVMGSMARGIYKSFEDMEPGALESIKEPLQKIRDDPNTPEDLKATLDKVLTPGNPIVVVLGVLLVLLMMTGTLGALLAPINRATEYKVDRVVESFRMDPMSIITAWRRDKEKYKWLFDDLEEQGWSDKKIEALKFLTLYYPSPAELIHWQAREVFEEGMIKKYGLRAEIDTLRREDFYKAGMDDTQIDNNWIAHWEHASWMQIVEMLHRGLITEEDVKEWFPLVEMAPHWADLLIDTAYTWPTRVDVRRWWDMRTIDETELRRLYSGMGYRGVNLDNYILWTKVYTAFPDLLARVKNEWISREDAGKELEKLGMPPERVKEMMETKFKKGETASIDEGKSLTKTDIYKGVKKEVITWEQGIELFMDLGYDEDEADYILTINVEALAGSPETFAEFKDITRKYRIATGREEKPMPEEIKQAAAEVVKLTAEVEALTQSIEEEKRGLVEEEVLPEETTKRLKSLGVKRNRAISELERVKSEYDRLIAEWKHGLP